VATSDPSGRGNDPFTLLPFAAGRATGTEVTEVLERV